MGEKRGSAGCTGYRSRRIGEDNDVGDAHAADSVSNEECLAGDVQRDPAGGLYA